MHYIWAQSERKQCAHLLLLFARDKGTTYSLFTCFGISHAQEKTSSPLGGSFHILCFLAWKERTSASFNIANNSFEVSGIPFLCSDFNYITCIMKNRKQRNEETMVIQEILVSLGLHFLCKARWFKTNAIAEHFSWLLCLGYSVSICVIK